MDLVTGLPPNPDVNPSELVHQITRDALGESVTHAKRQYDKNCFCTQYQVGNAVWYLIKGTKKVKNRLKMFLPSYKGLYFILTVG